MRFLYVSLRSRVSPSIFGLMFMGFVECFIFKSDGVVFGLCFFGWLIRVLSSKEVVFVIPVFV